jgi:hypothetical protein
MGGCIACCCGTLEPAAQFNCLGHKNFCEIKKKFIKENQIDT